MRYEARFAPTSADIMTGFRMHYRQSDDIWKVYVVGAVTAALVFGVAAYIMRFPVIAAVGAGVVLVVIGALLLQELPLRRQAKTVTGEVVSYVLTDDGVEFASSVAQSKLAWSAFTEARLDDRGLVLYTDRMTFSFIPARAFTAGYFPRAELKSILAAKLKKPKS